MHRQVQAALSTSAISRLLGGNSNSSVHSWCHRARELQVTQEVWCSTGSPLTPTPGNGHKAARKAVVLFPSPLNVSRQGSTGEGSFVAFSCVAEKRCSQAAVGRKLLLHFKELDLPCCPDIRQG